ncbi:MAG: hypothetical protein V2B18_01890, partial [Pseudomonadota bacterium]
GVKEYYLYDPTGDYLRPQLKGFTLDQDGFYLDVPVTSGPLGSTTIYSPILGLELRLEAGKLALFDPLNEEYLPSAEELREIAETETEARWEAEQRAREEASARWQAEQRAGEEAAARRQAERRAAAEAEAHREVAAKAQAAERLIAELMKELALLKGSKE